MNNKEYFIDISDVIVKILNFLKTAPEITTANWYYQNQPSRGVLKICSKLTGEDPCRIVISIKLQSNFIEITLRHSCSPVNLLHIFRRTFPKNTSEWLLLYCSNHHGCQLIYWRRSKTKLNYKMQRPYVFTFIQLKNLPLF